MASGPLVSAGQLAAELAGPAAPTVLDCRWELAGGADRAGYDRGHLPGAVFVDLDRDLSGPPGPGGRHPLPTPAAFQAVMRRAGVGQHRPVVAYDQGQPGGAARAWWLLGWFGHPGARNAPITDLAGDPGLPPPGRLRELLEAFGVRDGTPVGAYCGSGVVAAQLVLTLEVAGLPAALYPGSWSEWVADPSRPVATGPTP